MLEGKEKKMIKWIKIDVMSEAKASPPFFVGSMLRGALGFALKRVVCINPSYKCENCFAAKECVYHQFYEEKNVFHSYRLDIGLQPKNFDFSLYLFEDAIKSLPYVLPAIKKSFEEEGLGKERNKIKIKQIAVAQQIVYDGKIFHALDNIKENKLLIDSYSPNVEIEFTMPLRVKENNHFAKEAVALHTLINNIHSRHRQLVGEAPSKLGYKVEGEIVASSLKFVEMKRYSSRQKQGINMGGLKGSIKIKGLDMKSYEYLKIGEIIGAGKQTVFGVGSYTITEKK
jgi:hypothetical protein